MAFPGVLHCPKLFLTERDLVLVIYSLKIPTLSSMLAGIFSIEPCYTRLSPSCMYGYMSTDCGVCHYVDDMIFLI